MYNWVSKVIWALSCFSFLYCVLVPENLYHPLNQLDSKPKAVSVSIVLDFTLHSDWLFVIFSFFWLAVSITLVFVLYSQRKSSLLHRLWDIHFYFLHSLASPLPPSLPSSLPPSLSPSLPPSLPLSLSPSLPPFLPLSLSPSLPPSLPLSLSPSLPPSLPPSLSPSLPPSYSWCLFFDWMMVAELAIVTQSIAYMPSIRLCSNSAW